MIEPRFIPDSPAAGALSADLTIAGGLAFVTVMPVGPDNEIVGTTIEDQTRAAILDLQSTLERADLSLQRVVHLTIYLTDIATQREGFNQVYADFFTHTVPVRCAVGVAALARPGMLVELTAIAAA